MCRVNSGNPKFWLGLAHAKGEEGPRGLQEVRCMIAQLLFVCDSLQGIDFLYTAVALRGTYVEAYYNLGTSAYQVPRSSCELQVRRGLFIERRCRSAATLKRSKRFPRQSSWYQSTLGRILIWVLPCAFGPLRPFAPPPSPPQPLCAHSRSIV